MRYRPARMGEIRHSVGSPERVRHALGLGAPVSLREGLTATLDWMREPAETAKIVAMTAAAPRVPASRAPVSRAASR